MPAKISAAHNIGAASRVNSVLCKLRTCMKNIRVCFVVTINQKKPAGFQELIVYG